MVWSRGQTSFFCTWILVPVPFIENITLSPSNGLGTLVENQLIINKESQFSSLIYLSIFMPVPQCLDYCCFVGGFEIRKWNPPVLFFKNDLANLGAWHFHTNFRISLPISIKKNATGISRGIALNLHINIGSVAIITILRLLIHNHWLFPFI